MKIFTIEVNEKIFQFPPQDRYPEQKNHRFNPLMSEC